MPLRVSVCSLLALAVAISAGGCASTVSGTVVKAPDVTQLDPGAYPSHPGTPYGKANSASSGTVVEAHRIANSVVAPNQVDATLTRPSWFNTGTLASPDMIAVDMPAPGPAIAAAHHLLLGFSSCRTSERSGDHKILINVVLRFPDQTAAADAAAELATKVSPPAPGHPIPIANHRAALAQAADADDLHAVESFLPHGPYVLYQYAQSSEGADVAAHLVAATLDVQIPRIDAFAPTDPAGFRDLPVDPDGFLNRVVPPDENNGGMTNFGAYQPQGALHFEADPNAAAVYATGGVDAVAISRTTVYRARDASSAAQMVDMAAADTAAVPRAKPAAGVPGLPSAKCFDLGPTGPDQSRSRFRCFAHADRYVFKAESPQADDVAQQMASQYLMLAS